MQSGNNKHAAWQDEELAHEVRPLTPEGPGLGRAEPWREIEIDDGDDLGTLTGDRWYETPNDTSP